MLIGQGCSLRPINTTEASQGIYIGESPNGRALFYLTVSNSDQLNGEYSMRALTHYKHQASSSLIILLKVTHSVPY